MFPPSTSTLSLDAYLLRYNKPKLVHMTKKCKRSPSSNESLRYRLLIKTFLRTLTAEVLKEHLRHAAEKKKVSLESYLQKHQWNILKLTGANQMIIDLIYPRVSESLKLSSWGPLLTCLVLKAVKCLNKDELADLNVIQKMCRRYVIKYKSGRQKSLDRVKQDWSVLYTSTQKLADSAKNAKLIKSVRNFNDEVILQKERKVKRPYSAPARTKKRPSSLKSASLRRPATANSAYERRSTFSASSRRSWMDIVRQNHSNYYPPKQLLTQISMDDFSKADREIMENHNETIKVKKVVNNKEKHKPIKMNLMGNIQNNLKKPVDTKNSVNTKEKLERDKINLKENAQSNSNKKIVDTNALPKALDKTNNEQRLRELSGRLMSPVQIPRTFLDLKPIKKPIRLKSLKITSVVTKKEKGRKPKAATPWITKVKHARTKSKALPKPVLEHKNAKPMATKLKSARPKSEPIPKAVLEPNNAKPLASKVKHARPKSAPISKVVLEPKVAKPLATKVKHVRPKSEPVPKTVTPRTTKPKQTRPTSEPLPQVVRKKVIKADNFLRTVKAEAAKSMATKLKSLKPKSEPLPEIVRKGIKPIAKPKADSFPRTRKANVGTTANPQKKSKRLMDASFENISKVNSAPMDKTQQEQSVTTKEGKLLSEIELRCKSEPHNTILISRFLNFLGQAFQSVLCFAICQKKCITVHSHSLMHSCTAI